MERKQFLSNLSTTFFSQIFIMFVSILLSFVLPKFLSINDYSLWQLFVFYSSYTGVLLLGINDGFIIKNAGKEYYDLNKNTLLVKLILSFFVEIIIGIALCLLFVIFNIENRLFIYISLVLYMLFQNLFALVGSYHQATNNNKLYSKGCIIERLIFVILLFIALIFNLNDYYYFVIFNLVSVLSSIIYLYFKSDLYFECSFNHIKEETFDLIDDAKVGFKIMVANLSGTLIMGGCRVLIDQNWDITVFGKVALSISMLQLFLTFINKAGIVLFPAMKSISAEKNNEFLKLMYFSLIIVTPILLLCYFPLKMVIIAWLPNYTDSIVFFSILIIVCIYESKMNLIYSTYLKIHRYENLYLLINIISTFVFFCLSLVIISFSLGINYLLLDVIISMTIRDFLSGIFILERINVSFKYQLIEFIVIVFYLFIVLKLSNDLLIILLFLLASVVYEFLLRKKIKSILKIIKRKDVS